MLTALAAVILPIIAHLIFRRRSRPVELGTLRFLKVAVRRDTRRRRLKRWVLLALRVGCVVLLVLLFARPYRAEAVGGGDTGLTVILIDRSASMDRKRDGERLVEHALKKLPDVVTRTSSRSRVEVAWFDSKVEPVGQSEDGRVSLADLKAPAALTGGTDFAAALTWAGARCEAARGGGPLAVHVITDLQRTGFGSLDTLVFPKDVPVHVWDVGPAPTTNVAITEVRPTSLMVRADHPTTVQATVLNARPERLDQRTVRLSLSNRGKVITLPGVASAAPGAATTVTFETPPLGPGLWQGTVSVAGEDGFSIDDARHVAVFAAARPRVLLLDGAARDVAALGEAYFLERALGLAPPGETVPDAPFRLIVFPYGPEARLPDLREVDVLVAANVAGFPTADAERVKAFLDRGGSAVVFGGGNLTPGSGAGYANAGLAVGAIGGNHAARDVPFRISEFATDHPVLAPFADPQHGDLHRLTFSGCTRVTPADGVRVLAKFGDGTPIVLERQTGAGRVLWCAASVGREHGEWSRSRLFLPLVHQLVRGATGLTGAGPVRDLPARGEVPGVRSVGAGWEVRNLEPQESELEACSAEEFAKRLGVPLASGADESVIEAKKEQDGLELRAGELWPWVWLMLVLCWLAEGLLANRTVA
ncbi:MAG: BatA domain-containing protein [Planctomycetes bacterium]|nr:BatA domain-containing protein [Planctomycetota bacterium]